MSNPFVDHQNYETKPKRNSFDLSHAYHLTMQFGGLYPCLALEVNSGESFDIDASFGLRMMPMVFPVQTPINASIQFYYVPNRILMTDWKDFIYNNRDDIQHPFIRQRVDSDFWKTGSLADYLGVPTTFATLRDRVELAPIIVGQGFTVPVVYASNLICSYFVPNPGSFNSVIGSLVNPSSTVRTLSYEPSVPLRVLMPWIGEEVSSALLLSLDFFNTSALSGTCTITLSYGSTSVIDSKPFACLYCNLDVPSGVLSIIDVLVPNSYSNPTEVIQLSAATDLQAISNILYANMQELGIDSVFLNISVGSIVPESPLFPPIGEPIERQSPLYRLYQDVPSSGVYDLKDIAVNPFAYPETIPLNALPFRAYESVYNTYFRDIENDPFKIDGVVQYNRFVTNLGNGPDTTDYHLFYRNWEKDYLTSCTQSPQQGLAPLVGITTRGLASFRDAETGELYEAQMKVADDGTIQGVDGWKSNPSIAAARSALDLSTSGISINDLREVGGLQRWLENNIRRGLRYRDQVLANTGVKIRYDELDMPVYIGGFTRPVQVTSVTQSTPSTDEHNALGDIAGQASIFGASKHHVRHYCDEAGWIIGIMCVTPQPVYTQNLDKKFIKTDALSYYHPQFNHLGKQPVTIAEVAPIQAAMEGVSETKVFGYQRPWYNLIAQTDTAHGLLRTQLRDFLMNRTFARTPELGAEFLHVDPKQLNQVFSITDTEEDVIIGEIYFKIFAKRPISRFGIPRLEA